MAEFDWNGHPLDSLLYRLGSGTATREDQSRAYSELKAAIEEVHCRREQLLMAREMLEYIANGGEFRNLPYGVTVPQIFRNLLARIDAMKEPPHA